jgi:hypothetical protein
MVKAFDPLRDRQLLETRAEHQPENNRQQADQDMDKCVGF